MFLKNMSIKDYRKSLSWEDKLKELIGFSMFLMKERNGLGTEDLKKNFADEIREAIREGRK